MWWWAVVAVVGFAAETALVIWMARSDTAVWERDHRAVPARVLTREEATRHVRAAALLAWRPPPARRLPHLPHLHLPHVHLPAGVAARLPHPHRAHAPRPDSAALPALAPDPVQPAGVDETPTGTPSSAG